MCSAESARVSVSEDPGPALRAHPVAPPRVAGAPRLAACTSVAAFLVPGLALWLPSGYSWGALLLLVTALLSLHRWPRHRPDAGTCLLAAAMLAMGLLWVLQADPQLGSARWDRFSKFALAVPCLWCALAYPPAPRALVLGVVVGCLGAGGIALWQVLVEGLPRAHGHTNAIQFGNLALLLGVLAAVQLACLYAGLGRWARLALVLAIVAALQASVLSLTRGGWLAVLLLPVLCVPLLRAGGRLPHWPAGRWVLPLLAVALAIPVAWQMPNILQRLDLVHNEVQSYQDRRSADTSIGHRLEHWRLAWHMGWDRPLTGWGDAGYKEEKARLVAQGRFDESTTWFDHAHNEVLDLFAKRGLLGVGLLMVFYGVPLALFWPGRARMRRWRLASAGPAAGLAAQARMALALRLSGVAIVLMYVGFGWTQVFFAHNSGVMFYLFMLVLCWTALRGLDNPAPSCGAA